MGEFPRLTAAIFILALGAGGPTVASAQDTLPSPRSVPVDTGSVEVRLVDGSTLYGRVVGESEDVVRLLLISGDTIELRRERIQSIRALQGNVVDGKVWLPDPNGTRLFFAPTGRSLPRGSGYFSVYELIVPFLAVGVTDRFTIAGGTPLIFGSGDRVFWLAPKLQLVRSERVQAGVGLLHFFFIGGGDSSVGIAYAASTFGDPDQALTAGAGMPYDSGDLANQPVFLLGGEKRVSRRIKLITENYFFPGDGVAVLAAGPRFFGENLTADVGLAAPVGLNDSFFAFPLVSFVYNW